MSVCPDSTIAAIAARYGNGGRQLDRHDPGADEPRRVAARLLAAGEACGDARAHAPQHRRRRKRGTARHELDQVHRVRARLAHAREQGLTGPEGQREPAGEGDREDAEREGRDVAPAVRPDGVEERRGERRRVQRVRGGDRDDEGEEREHRASLSHACS